MATTEARKRGRPRRDATQSVGGIVEQVRNDLNGMVGTCETCHRPLNSIGPLATEAGVNPVILANFMKGRKGVSMDTLDTLWKFTQNRKANGSEPEPVPAEA